MKGAYLGPDFSEKDTQTLIKRYGAKYQYFDDFNELTKVVAKKIAEGDVT
jgi:carbamoyltransferase